MLSFNTSTQKYVRTCHLFQKDTQFSDRANIKNIGFFFERELLMDIKLKQWLGKLSSF